MTADLHQRILAAIEAEEAVAKAAAGVSYDHMGMSWPRTEGKDALMAFVNANRPEQELRRYAEDRDVLSRHKSVDWYEGGTGCWYCSGEHDVSFSHRVVDWPCPEVLSLARRLGVDP